jgi:hypothetical protein
MYELYLQWTLAPDGMTEVKLARYRELLEAAIAEGERPRRKKKQRNR